MQFPEHGVWSNNKIRTALEAFDADECSDVDYGSITPGMSFALVEYAFSADTDRMTSLIEMDLKDQLDRATYLLTSDTVSDFDQSSTISILVELPDHDVCIGS